MPCLHVANQLLKFSKQSMTLYIIGHCNERLIFGCVLKVSSMSKNASFLFLPCHNAVYLCVLLKVLCIQLSFILRLSAVYIFMIFFWSTSTYYNFCSQTLKLFSFISGFSYVLPQWSCKFLQLSGRNPIWSTTHGLQLVR